MAGSAVLTVASPWDDVKGFAGGKGRNLYTLSRHGFAVPRWAVLPTGVWTDFVRASGLGSEIDAILKGTGPDTASEKAERIEAALLGRDVGPDTLAGIETAYHCAGGSRVAVRSSGADEDGSSVSFAGQYNTFLNVTGLAAVVEHVKRCWASAYSARCLTYRLSHKLPLDLAGMAVIIQEMVDADKSGVVFTANPISGAKSEIVISSVYGLGEGLVSGAVDADMITIDRTSGRVKEAQPGEKQERYVADGGNGIAARPVEPADSGKLSLSGDEIEAVRAAAEKIEAVFKSPQDIEWSIENGKLKILQARPITTALAADGDSAAAGTVLHEKRVQSAEATIWENSNIIENFSDITSPLTFSFAQEAYWRVHRESCRLNGVPRRLLDQMDDWMRNMLGHHNGRVYYNLLNWYKVIGVTPFYDLNKRMLEFLIGAEEPLDDAVARSQKPYRTSRPAELAIRALGRVLYAWHFATVAWSVNRFVRYFYRVHAKYEAIDYAALPAEEVYGHFRQFRQELLCDWGRMILLEQTIGMSVGLLSVMTKKWLPDAPEWFFFEMLKPDEALESLQPVHRMRAIAETIEHDAELSALVTETAPDKVYDLLRNSDKANAKALLGEVDRYIDAFGYRSVNELKLEAPDMREDPSVFFYMLKSVLGQLRSKRPMAANESAGAYLDAHMRGWRRIAYALVRGKARRCLAARERVRFCRSRAFGSSRRMFKAIGAYAARTGMLTAARDIFYLRLDELTGWFDGVVTHKEALGLIALRQAQEAENRRWEGPGRFVTHGLIATDDYEKHGWRRIDDAAEPALAAGATIELRGTPSCAGVVEGEAQVVTEPRDVGGKILVTYRTDPGWCAVLPSASALLIERGSPLTHVAIVARELNIPTVIQIKDLTKRIKTGMPVKVDGGTGLIQAGGR
jgi:rifampicin phosphotransferase